MKTTTFFIDIAASSQACKKAAEVTLKLVKASLTYNQSVIEQLSRLTALVKQLYKYKRNNQKRNDRRWVVFRDLFRREFIEALYGVQGVIKKTRCEKRVLSSTFKLILNIREHQCRKQFLSAWAEE